jgi:hypothetical protein
MGFIVMGIFAFTPEAMSGALLQNINHGISTGALFLIVGMIYDRRHSREIADFQGIAAILPVFTLMFMIAGTLPGMAGRNTSHERMVPSRIGTCTSFSTISSHATGCETFLATSAPVAPAAAAMPLSPLWMRPGSVEPDLVVLDDPRPARDLRLHE